MTTTSTTKAKAKGKHSASNRRLQFKSKGAATKGSGGAGQQLKLPSARHIEFTAEDGSKYFLDSDSRATTWELPDLPSGFSWGLDDPTQEESAEFNSMSMSSSTTTTNPLVDSAGDSRLRVYSPRNMSLPG